MTESERRIAELEAEIAEMRERIAELEHANRVLASGVSTGYWRAAARLAGTPVTPPIDLPPPTDLGEPRRT